MTRTSIITRKMLDMGTQTHSPAEIESLNEWKWRRRSEKERDVGENRARITKTKPPYTTHKVARGNNEFQHRTNKYVSRCRLKKSISFSKSYKIIGIKTCFVRASKQNFMFHSHFLSLSLSILFHFSSTRSTNLNGGYNSREENLKNTRVLQITKSICVSTRSHRRQADARNEKADKCFGVFVIGCVCSPYFHSPIRWFSFQIFCHQL